MNILYYPQKVIDKAIEESYNAILNSEDDGSNCGI